MAITKRKMEYKQYSNKNPTATVQWHDARENTYCNFKSFKNNGVVRGFDLSTSSSLLKVGLDWSSAVSLFSSFTERSNRHTVSCDISTSADSVTDSSVVPLTLIGWTVLGEDGSTSSCSGSSLRVAWSVFVASGTFLFEFCFASEKKGGKKTHKTGVKLT